jgi:hypothetical protein
MNQYQQQQKKKSIKAGPQSNDPALVVALVAEEQN